MKKAFVLTLFFICVPGFLRADDMQKQMQIASLKREISELELELAACKQSNKGWRTATVVGAVGAATTGAIAIGQGVKLHKMKQAGMEQKKETTK